MTKAHDRYNRLFRQTHNTFQIHHLALLMLKDYITILMGTLQRIHRQYVRYKSALDNTLIGIEHLNSGYLTQQEKTTWKKRPQHLNQYSQMYISITVIR